MTTHLLEANTPRRRFFMRKKYIFLTFIISSLLNYSMAEDQKDVESPLKNKLALIDSLKGYKYISPDRAIEFSMEVLQRKKYSSGKYPKIESSFYNDLGEIYLRMNLPSQALSYFIEAKNLMIGKKTPWLDVQFGNVYYHQGQWLKAKESYNKALETFSTKLVKGDRLADGKKTGGNSVAGMSTCLSNLGLVEIQLKNFDNALSLYEKALEVTLANPLYLKSSPHKTIGPTQSVAKQQLSIANLYHEWSMDDLATEQINSIDSLLLPIIQNNKLGELQSQNQSLSHAFRVYGLVNTLKCKIFVNEKKFKDAKKSVNFASELLRQWPIYLTRNYVVAAKMYFSQDSLYAALEEIDKGLRVCKLKGLGSQSLILLQLKMDFLEKSNLNKSALNVAGVILEKRKEIDVSKMKGIIESVELKTDLYNSRNQLVKAQRKQRVLQILIGLILIGSGLVVLFFRNKKKSSEQIAIISKQENKIAKVELKMKEAELMNLSTYELSKNDLLSNIVKDLEYHMTLISDTNDQKTLKPLRKKIQGFIDEGVEWEDYKVQFAMVHPNFVEYLTSNNPEITNGDIKLCCYLKMNMNTKDIAQLFGLSVRAIENKRYRLRKKLALTTETSLISFINGIQ